jgi:hypothetical protein
LLRYAKRTYSTNNLYLKIDQKWSGHGLTSLTGSYGLGEGEGGRERERERERGREREMSIHL